MPPGPTYCTYGVHVPASGVGYVPGTVATQVYDGTGFTEMWLAKGLNKFLKTQGMKEAKTIEHKAERGKADWRLADTNF